MDRGHGAGPPGQPRGGRGRGLGHGRRRPWPGRAAGGPHTVVALGEEGELEAAAFAGLTDSADPVAYEPAPEVGTNLELVVPLGEETDPDTQSSVGIARVRVLERGVGESLSYGAGCCAVAVALHAWTGPGAPEDYRLLVPGGEIGVHVGADPRGEDSSGLLTGPATITGRVTVV